MQKDTWWDQFMMLNNLFKLQAFSFRRLLSVGYCQKMQRWLLNEHFLQRKNEKRYCRSLPQYNLKPCDFINKLACCTRALYIFCIWIWKQHDGEIWDTNKTQKKCKNPTIERYVHFSAPFNFFYFIYVPLKFVNMCCCLVKPIFWGDFLFCYI